MEKKNITFIFLPSFKYLLCVSRRFPPTPPHVRDVCCACSTASNYNNDMQVHVMRAEGMLIDVLVVFGIKPEDI